MKIGIVACAAGLSLGCAGGEPASEAGLDSLVTDSIPRTTTERAPEPGSEAFPALPGEGEPRRYRLLLVNRLDVRTFVYASAGATRVLLDTVPPSDSVAVDIRLRADQVELEAEDEDGRSRSSTSLRLSGGVHRWVIADARSSREVAIPALVRVGPARYPRTRSD